MEFVIEQLHKNKGKWRRIARDAGVPYDTLTKIALSRVTDPRVSNVQALHDYFVGAEASLQSVRREEPIPVTTSA
ncbi:hypothetical protein [Burkholderia sp. S-53]|uniref:hypothetical protein n=1 Tax=Burkholderia sp. S-53 TaxID=2906514 RepID=UPI0021D15FEB|nr:hypothetical protein [Burkholderia sp. S-53]UXU87006.1 hypothetical protein LXM88_17810 [Burkholderia sp. S-53]